MAIPGDIQQQQDQQGHSVHAQRLRPLGQSGQAQGDPESGSDPEWRRFPVKVRGVHQRQARLADGDEQEQDSIGDAELRRGEDQSAGAEDEDGPDRPRVAGVAADDGAQKQRGENDGDGGRESCGLWGVAFDLHGEQLAPINQRRLFQPPVAEVFGNDPVAGLEHLAAALGVARLVAVPQRYTMGAEQI